MRRALCMIGAILLAVALSQFPEYAQQYTQRLGGAVDELAVVTARFDADAAASGLDRPAALSRYRQSSDAFIAGQGESWEVTFARYERLSAALAELRSATGWERAMLIPQLADTEIGARTLADFHPAVPVTAEGFVYAGLGLIAGYGLTALLVALVLLPFRRRRPRYREI